MKGSLSAIRSLVGEATKEQLRHIDCFVSRDVALFMPVSGACFYALSPEHTHPSYMFVLNFNDQTAVRMNGAVLHSKPGSIFALSPDIPHQELPSDSPPRYICIMIGKQFFEQQYRRYSHSKPDVLRGKFIGPIDGLLQLLKRFMIEADTDVPGKEKILEALGIEICHALIRAIRKLPTTKSPIADRVEIGRVIEHLHAHIDEKITIERMASIACLSPSHFSRVFKQDMRKAPMEYLHDLRMERAKKMLLAADASVTEIALACGFGSPSYLSACFQKKYKMTPKEYRKTVG
jgi:AraC family transcriptional regulator